MAVTKEISLELIRTNLRLKALLRDLDVVCGEFTMVYGRLRELEQNVLATMDLVNALALDDVIGDTHGGEEKEGSEEGRQESASEKGGGESDDSSA